jgi:hypothetical protein
MLSFIRILQVRGAASPSFPPPMVSSSTVCTYLTIRVASLTPVGGYCKEYTKGKRPVGIMLDDTWFLRSALYLLLTLWAKINHLCYW